MTRAAPAALSLLLLAAACGGAEPARGAASASPGASRDDQRLLGRELYELIDRAADFRASHRGRYPASVAQMGIDSLTPATARRLSSRGDTLTVTVEFRRPAGHALASCTGGAEALEGASLNTGRFPASCITPDGEVEPLELDAGSR